MLSLLSAYNTHIAYPFRQSRLVKKILPHISPHKTVLDIGSGDGKLLQILSSKIHMKSARGIDTVKQEKTYVPITLYDGYTLPFRSKSFDIVLIVDVLHHDTHPEHIMKEAKRVAKETVIIKDHYYTNHLDFFILKIYDYLGNRPYHINLPYNFYTLDQWDALFKKLSLNISYTERFRLFAGDLGKQVVFVVRI